MPGINGENRSIKNINAYGSSIGNKTIKKVFAGNKLVWPAGTEISYVANGVTYREYVEKGQTVLSPTSFTPTKDGWSFLGWSKTNGQYNWNIETNLVAGDEPMTLYAVWSRGSYIPDQPLSFTYNGPADELNYNPGGDWSASVSADEITDMGNNTAGEVAIFVKVSGTTIRGFVMYADGAMEEYSSYPGSGGKTVTISGDGPIIGSIQNMGAWKWSGGYLHVSNVVLKGSSSKEYSVG